MFIGNGCITTGTITHELLHALGLFHEHQRKDRDDWVYIHRDNINLKEKHIKANFDKCRGCEDYGIPYNIESIMHYPSNAFPKNVHKPTITPLDPTQAWIMGASNELGIHEEVLLKKMYKCTPPDYLPLLQFYGLWTEIFQSLHTQLGTIEVKNSVDSYNTNDHFYVEICNPASCCTASLDSNHNDFQSGNLDTFTDLDHTDSPEEILGNCEYFSISEVTSFKVMRWGMYTNWEYHTGATLEEYWKGDYIKLKSVTSRIVHVCTYDDWIPADQEWHQFSCQIQLNPLEYS